MKMNDYELFAKLNEAFNELFGSENSEDTSADLLFEKAPSDPFEDNE